MSGRWRKFSANRVAVAAFFAAAVWGLAFCAIAPARAQGAALALSDVFTTAPLAPPQAPSAPLESVFSAPESAFSLESLLAAPGPNPAAGEEADRLLAVAKSHLARGEVAPARARLREALARGPQDGPAQGEALLLLAATAPSAAEAETCLALLADRAASSGPLAENGARLALAWSRRAAAGAPEPDAQSAGALLRLAERMTPAAAPPALKIEVAAASARSLMDEGQGRAALERMSALERDPALAGADFPPSWRRLKAMCAVHAGALGLARETLEELRERHPADPESREALPLLGLLYESQAAADEARRCYALYLAGLPSGAGAPEWVRERERALRQEFFPPPRALKKF